MTASARVAASWTPLRPVRRRRRHCAVDPPSSDSSSDTVGATGVGMANPRSAAAACAPRVSALHSVRV
eukprot:8278843-Pyramimonas_sp.AAC.1